MLAGIRTGKKKQKTGSSGVRSAREGSNSITDAVSSAARQDVVSNQSVADQLRRALVQGDHGTATSSSSSSAPITTSSAQQAKFAMASKISDRREHESSGVIVASSSHYYANKNDMTIQEMLAEEKTTTTSLYDQETKHLLRQGKHGKRKKANNVNDDDYDYDDVLNTSNVYLGEEQTEKAQRRQLHRQQAEQNRLEKSLVGNQCWWWLRAPSFDRDRLLALGNYVSLVMAPTHRSLQPFEHFYLVPIPHVESLASADAQVWNEIYQFQAALTNLYRPQHKNLVYLETVLPSSKGVWQTKLECVVVPEKDWHEVPLYFRSALAEQQAHEHGVHQKLLRTHMQTQPLYRTIPSSNKFPYFFVQYDPQCGFAQLIEDRASFPKDFGLETLTGMLQMDPIRFRKHQAKTSKEQELQGIRQFLQQWKVYDWTTSLDEEK